LILHHSHIGFENWLSMYRV